MEQGTIKEAFAGKKILITGHTGFKGAWLSLWLSELGAKVYGFAARPLSDEGLYSYLDDGVFAAEQIGDIANPGKVAEFVDSVQPDLLFHMAAQPLVRQSYVDPIDTLSVNIIGSARVLEAVRSLKKTCHVIFVTSDKCYKNNEWCFSYRETDALGGKDPYSMSKAAAELVAESWRRAYFDQCPYGSRVISVRAGNVIGGGDYSVDRLVPDCVRAAVAGEALVMRNPKATRPWQHVLDCLHGYLVTAARVPSMQATADLESFNFGPKDPHEHPVVEVAESFFSSWGADTPGVRVEQADAAKAEATYLSVSIEKAQRILGWQPVWTFSDAMRATASWYSAKHVDKKDMLSYSRSQLADFVHAASDC